MHDNDHPIDELIHMYVDGSVGRRHMVREIAKYTGSVAAAIAAVRSSGMLVAQTRDACPADVKVPENAPDIETRNVQYPGETGGTVFGYLAWPRSQTPQTYPGVLVLHENRGLVEHIKDVTRRVARAGFVGLGVDMLSSQGGTDQFPDAAQQSAAFNRTTPQTRIEDIYASLGFLKRQPQTQWDSIGCLGFCSGGGDAARFAAGTEELKAAVVFYGNPVPPVDQFNTLNAALLLIYGEADRNLTGRLPPVLTAFLERRKTFGLHVYDGAGHAFHNDTSPNYNRTGACDAWNRTIDWFNRYLKRPA
ncbi:MAG: dienelactone hydrolase family protein [Bryobacteraceae bacterium]